MRFLFYSHDGFGLGHTCRNLAIARALTEFAPRASVLLATGSDDVTRLGVPDRVEILKLPGLRKLANESYASRYLDVPPEEVRLLRSRLLLSAIEGFRPNVLLVDKHPFGAGGELRDALTAMRRIGGSSVLGLRDILDEPETVRAEWAPHNLPSVIPAFYDSVLVYGQENIFDAASAYGFSYELSARTKYVGYVAHLTPGINASIPPPPPGAEPLVIATVGGGEDGYQLLKTFLHAAAGAPWRAIAVTGPMMNGSKQAKLNQLALNKGTTLHTFVPELNQWYASAGAVVCMGGYNTLTQTLAAWAPVVCVPRVQPRREQIVRSEAFARLGLMRSISPENLTPQLLRKEITEILNISRPELRSRIQSRLEFDGAENAARHLVSLARNPLTSLQNKTNKQPILS